MNATGSVRTTLHRTHTRAFFSLRTPHVITRLAQRPDDSFVRPEKSLHLGLRLLNVPSSPIPSCHLTVYCRTDATDRNQTKPVCDYALAWNVWPSGRSDSKHSSVPHEICPEVPQCEDRSEEETLKQERCARRVAWEMAKKYPQAQSKGHGDFLLAFGCMVSTSTTPNETRGKIICGGCWGFDAHAEHEKSEFSGTGSNSSFQKPNNGHHAHRRTANKRGSNSVRQQFICS